MILNKQRLEAAMSDMPTAIIEGLSTHLEKSFDVTALSQKATQARQFVADNFEMVSGLLLKHTPDLAATVGITKAVADGHASVPTQDIKRIAGLLLDHRMQQTFGQQTTQAESIAFALVGQGMSKPISKNLAKAPKKLCFAIITTNPSEVQAWVSEEFAPAQLMKGTIDEEALRVQPVVILHDNEDGLSFILYGGDKCFPIEQVPPFCELKSLTSFGQLDFMLEELPQTHFDDYAADSFGNVTEHKKSVVRGPGAYAILTSPMVERDRLSTATYTNKALKEVELVKSRRQTKEDIMVDDFVRIALDGIKAYFGRKNPEYSQYDAIQQLLTHSNSGSVQEYRDLVRAKIRAKTGATMLPFNKYLGSTVDALSHQRGTFVSKTNDFLAETFYQLEAAQVGIEAYMKHMAKPYGSK